MDSEANFSNLVGFLSGMGPSSVDHKFVRTVKALAALIADEWLLKGVL